MCILQGGITMDTTENRIKEMIINKYGSLKKFCEIINMPWTTLDSILKRGFSNSNITNVMKISHELKVDTESLASGKIVDSAERTEYGKQEIPKILKYYDILNDIGKHVATERVKELAEVPRYTKINLLTQAARNDYEQESGELEAMQDDIVNFPNQSPD